MKSATVAAVILASVANANAQDAQPIKPSQTCQQNCQPLGRVSVCNKHCWSYRGGPGSVLVQTTVTWSTTSPAVAQRAKPKIKEVSSDE